MIIINKETVEKVVQEIPKSASQIWEDNNNNNDNVGKAWKRPRCSNNNNNNNKQRDCRKS